MIQTQNSAIFGTRPLESVGLIICSGILIISPILFLSPAVRCNWRGCCLWGRVTTFLVPLIQNAVIFVKELNWLYVYKFYLLILFIYLLYYYYYFFFAVTWYPTRLIPGTGCSLLVPYLVVTIGWLVAVHGVGLAWKCLIDMPSMWAKLYKMYLNLFKLCALESTLRFQEERI